MGAFGDTRLVRDRQVEVLIVGKISSALQRTGEILFVRILLS
jgi:hypothetical protein